MKHEIIKEYQGFLNLRDEWNSLLSRSESNSVFLTWEWLDAWWQAYRTTEDPYIIVFRDRREKLVGIAPLVLNVLKLGHIFKYKAIYFWGLKMNIKESEYLDIISEKGLEEDICIGLVQILNERRKDWDIFFYYEVPDVSPYLPVMRKLIRERKWLSQETSHGCSFIKLPDIFDDYITSLKPRMRTKLRSLPRRLNENHKVEFEVCSQKEDMPSVLKSLMESHQQRWQAEGRLGTFSCPERRDFYRILSNHFIENNWLLIFSLKVDNVYRAHEYGFLYNKKLFILQEGYDKDWEKKGVGNILRTYILQYCINNKCEEYDFLGGVTYHKNSWGVEIKNSASVATGTTSLKTLVFLYRPVVIEKLRTIYRLITPQAIIQWKIDLSKARKARNIRKILDRENAIRGSQ